MRFEKITSRQNPEIKRIRALSRDKSERSAAGEFVCDGEKLLGEAIASGMEIGTILANEERIPEIPDDISAKCLAVPQDILDSITTLKSAQSVIFTCRMKKRAALGNIRRAIILDSLQDTGNIGTIIRTADAFGVDAVFADGCADIYNPKTIRSAMGSIFRVPVFEEKLQSLIPRLRSEGYKVYCSELRGDVAEISECDFSKCAVVIGNEGNGVRPEVSDLCDRSVIIPMQGGAESLNAAVAAAIFMFKMSER